MKTLKNISDTAKIAVDLLSSNEPLKKKIEFFAFVSETCANVDANVLYDRQKKAVVYCTKPITENGIEKKYGGNFTNKETILNALCSLNQSGGNSIYDNFEVIFNYGTDIEHKAILNPDYEAEFYRDLLSIVSFSILEELREELLEEKYCNYLTGFTTQQTAQPQPTECVLTEQQEKQALDEFHKLGNIIMKNTREKVKDSEFYDMIGKCNFSSIDYNKCKTKLKRLVADISDFVGNDWGEKTAQKSFACSLDECKKMPKNNKE